MKQPLFDPFTGEQVREPTQEEIDLFLQQTPKIINAGFSFGIETLKTICNAFGQITEIK